jgi:hypothetical protein
MTPRSTGPVRCVFALGDLPHRCGADLASPLEEFPTSVSHLGNGPQTPAVTNPVTNRHQIGPDLPCVGNRFRRVGARFVSTGCIKRRSVGHWSADGAQWGGPVAHPRKPSDSHAAWDVHPDRRLQPMDWVNNLCQRGSRMTPVTLRDPDATLCRRTRPRAADASGPDLSRQQPQQPQVAF